MSSRGRALVVVVVLLAGVVACGRERDRASEAGVTGSQVAALTFDSAVDRLVKARCVREATCPAEAGSDAGADASASSRAGCAERVAPRVKGALGVSGCAEGFSAQALEICVTALETESCSRPVDEIVGVAPCRARDLCSKTTGTPYRLME